MLPILQGDRLIGRLDPVGDRKRRLLTLRAIHAETGRVGPESATEIATSIQELAAFVGADRVTPMGSIPAAWRQAFRKAF